MTPTSPNRRPLISIITPVFNPPAEALAECLGSVERQTFDDWEHCVVNDASTDPEVGRLLRMHQDRDPRVKVHHREVNGGIVSASNDALAMATGEFIVLLDHDDTLAPTALEQAQRCLDADPTIDVLYSDSDKLSAEGQHVDEFKKPDWSPERLRAQNYVIHMTVIRRQLVEEVGRFREGFDGSQDHDLILRVTERARTVHHLPETLYHWRQVPGSTAAHVLAKPAAFTAGERAVQEHCDRIGLHAKVDSSQRFPGTYRVRRQLVDRPAVSIIIPTIGSARKVWGQHTRLIFSLLQSLLDTTQYENFEIIVVLDPKTPDGVVRRLGVIDDERVVAIWGDAPFNWSRTSNLGFAAARGDLLLFMNDDMFVDDPTWLEQLVAHATEADVGAVGPLLVYEDGRIQSAGHCHAGEPNHIGRLASSSTPGPFSLFQITRECSGITGACLLTPRSVFEEVGGMCEDFPNSYNDVDYCIKVRRAGRRIIWTPLVRIFHFEESSRDPMVASVDHDSLYRRWWSEFCRDPYVPDGPWALGDLTSHRRGN